MNSTLHSQCPCIFKDCGASVIVILLFFYWHFIKCCVLGKAKSKILILKQFNETNDMPCDTYSCKYAVSYCVPSNVKQKHHKNKMHRHIQRSGSNHVAGIYLSELNVSQLGALLHCIWKAAKQNYCSAWVCGKRFNDLYDKCWITFPL